MITITDDYMREMIPTLKAYCVCILKAGPKRKEPGVEKIIWEHARRNLALKTEGLMPIVCPVMDDSEVDGLSVFAVSVEAAAKLMDEDPGVKAGIFVYELHPCRSFPGSSLP